MNIPLLSYLILRGKCSNCRSPISPRYPLVELIVPALWLAGVHVYEVNRGPIPVGFLPLMLTFLTVVVITTATDFDWKIIPDQATFFLLAVGILSSPWNPLIQDDRAFVSVFRSLLGAVVGWGVLWATSSIGKKLFRKEVMGGGDLKLLAGIGALLGWQGALVSLFLAAAIGSVTGLVGIAAKVLKRHQYIPFGPFLNAGALAALFWMFAHPNTVFFLLEP
jgi:leader peptidase (prepilin peptidase)/N-methyltransferase